MIRNRGSVPIAANMSAYRLTSSDFGCFFNRLLLRSNFRGGRTDSRVVDRNDGVFFFQQSVESVRLYISIILEIANVSTGNFVGPGSLSGKRLATACQKSYGQVTIYMPAKTSSSDICCVWEAQNPEVSMLTLEGPGGGRGACPPAKGLGHPARASFLRFSPAKRRACAARLWTRMPTAESPVSEHLRF